MGTPSSARIIQYVDLELKALEIVYQVNVAAVEGLVDRNGHRRKELDECKRVSWGGAHTKFKGHECKLAKKTFFHNYLWQLCLKKKT